MVAEAEVEDEEETARWGKSKPTSGDNQRDIRMVRRQHHKNAPVCTRRIDRAITLPVGRRNSAVART